MSPPILVTAAIIEEDGKYLITKRREDVILGGLWEFNGGKVKPGENLGLGLEREVFEELRIRIRVRDFFGSEDHVYDGGPHILLIGFHCDRISGKIQHIGVQDHRWVYPNEMRSYDFCPADSFIIKKLNTV